MRKIIAALLLVMVLCSCSGSSTAWPKGKCSSELPKPKKGEVEVLNSSDSSFSINIRGISGEEADEYEDQLYESGFTENYTKRGHHMRATKPDVGSFTATYNEEESRLYIEYYSATK